MKPTSHRPIRAGLLALVAALAMAWGTSPAQAQTWTQLPGAAIDIGAGANGALWIIGAPGHPGGYGIYRWEGGNWVQVRHMPYFDEGNTAIKDGGPENVVERMFSSDFNDFVYPTCAMNALRRIAVDPQGNAWVADRYWKLFRWVPEKNVWLKTLPKDTHDGRGAVDIAIGANGVAWCPGSDLTSAYEPALEGAESREFYYMDTHGEWDSLVNWAPVGGRGKRMLLLLTPGEEKKP